MVVSRVMLSLREGERKGESRVEVMSDELQKEEGRGRTRKFGVYCFFLFFPSSFLLQGSSRLSWFFQDGA